MRCPECNRFVAYEDPDPEVLDLDVDGTEVRAEVRVTRCCADCGCELLEAVVNPWYDVSDSYEAHLADEARRELEDEAVEGGGPAPTDEQVSKRAEELWTDHTLEVSECWTGRDEGVLPGRPRRACQEVWVTYSAECSCGGWSHDGELREPITADQMEVLV